MEQNEMLFLPAPVNQCAEILYELLSCPTRMSFSQLYAATHICGISQRLSDLRRKGLQIVCLMIETKNKHGRPTEYGTWTIAGEKEKALEIYHQINKK